MTERETKVLEQMERELSPVSEHDIPHGPLFHYTNSAGLLGILNSKHLWATDVRHLNDREELRIGEQVVQEEAASLAKEFAPASAQGVILQDFTQVHEQLRLSKVTNIYVASLSEQGDQLSQWRAYGADGAGYAIGFHDFVLPKSAREDAEAALALMRCEYDIDVFRRTVRSALRETADVFAKYWDTYVRDEEFGEAMGNEAISLALRRVAIHVPRLKHRAFSEEREWRLVMMPSREHEHRLVRFRSTGVGVTPYLEVPMAPSNSPMDVGIIRIGPTHDPESGIAATRLLLRSLGYTESVAVERSIAPYRAVGGRVC